MIKYFEEEQENENKHESVVEKHSKYHIVKYQNTHMYLNLETGLNIQYTRNFLNTHDSKKYFKLFEKYIKYNSAEESKVLIRGQYIDIPRTQTAYGDPGTYYKFSGNVVKAKNWLEKGLIESILQDIVHKLEIYCGTKFNFVLINKYADGTKYIGFHSDDEKDLGPEPKIAGVSFGQTRPIYFQNKVTGDTDVKQDLEPGSVVVMNHPTNVHWRHSIPKTSKQMGTRISLTFRKMYIK